MCDLLRSRVRITRLKNHEKHLGAIGETIKRSLAAWVRDTWQCTPHIASLKRVSAGYRRRIYTIRSSVLRGNNYDPEYDSVLSVPVSRSRCL